MGPLLALLLLAGNAVDGREAALELQAGSELMARESFDDAEDHLRRAARLAPRAPEPRYLLGRLYMATDRPGEAVIAYRACLENLARRASLASGASLESDHAAAVRDLVDGRQEAEVHLRLGSAQFRAGDLVGAERSFRRSLEVHPTGEAHNNLAVVYVETGRVRDAAGAVERALRAGYPVSRALRARVEAAARPAEGTPAS